MMFRIAHNKENVSSVLSNGIGGILFLGCGPLSKYQGFSFNKQFEMFKVVDNLVLESNPEWLEYETGIIRRIHKNNTEEFFLPKDYDVLYHRLKRRAKVRVDLDVRKSYDQRKFGYNYHTFHLDDILIIKTTKRTDSCEDPTHGCEEYVVYTVIINDGTVVTVPDRWTERRYPYDAQRHDDNIRYVYEAVTIECNRMAIGVGTDLHSVIKKTESVWNRKHEIETTQPKPGNFSQRKEIIQPSNNNDWIKKVHRTYLACKIALNNAYQKIYHHKGLYAGFPYFFQFWTRDSAISAKGLASVRNSKDIAHDLLTMSYILNDGRVANRIPHSMIGSADGVGWVFFRISELLDLYTKKEKKIITERLIKSIERINRYFVKDKLVWNGPKETWMDTDANSGGREGFCIEIQALFLSMLKLAQKLADDKRHFTMEQDLKSKVKKYFLIDGMIYDRVDDKTVRPNIFIAYYVYPELFTRDEWEEAFKKSLDELWLEWGGIASISTKDARFIDRYTGANNKSYHCGDSWFYLNCMAAICMHKVNNKSFDNKIRAIIDACVKEVYSGCVGHLAEVSSAAQLEGRGCLSQTWSHALFIELYEHYFTGDET